MPIYYNKKKIGDVCLGATRIQQGYEENTLVYEGIQHGTILLNTSTPGTYSVIVPYNCTVHIDMVGGGGGSGGHLMGSSSHNVTRYACSGGSGAYLSGNITIKSGVYSVVVGEGGAKGTAGNWYSGAIGGSGGSTTFYGQTAGGGGGGQKSAAGSAGTATTTVGLSKTNGNAGGKLGTTKTGKTVNGGASVYGGYGAGANAQTSNTSINTYAGVSGYCKIYIV